MISVLDLSSQFRGNSERKFAEQKSKSPFWRTNEPFKLYPFPHPYPGLSNQISDFVDTQENLVRTYTSYFVLRSCYMQILPTGPPHSLTHSLTHSHSHSYSLAYASTMHQVSSARLSTPYTPL